MKIRRLGIACLMVSMLTGCSNHPDIAYWTDSSYKSCMDFEAEQKYELRDELIGVHGSLNDLVNSGNLGTMTPTEDLENSKDEANGNTTETSTILVSKTAPGETITYMRHCIRKNSALTSEPRWYGSNQNHGLVPNFKPTGLAESLIMEYNEVQFLDLTGAAISAISDDVFAQNFVFFLNKFYANTGAHLGDVTLDKTEFEAKVVLSIAETTMANSNFN